MFLDNMYHLLMTLSKIIWNIFQQAFRPNFFYYSPGEHTIRTEIRRILHKHFHRLLDIFLSDARSLFHFLHAYFQSAEWLLNILIYLSSACIWASVTQDRWYKTPIIVSSTGSNHLVRGTYLDLSVIHCWAHDNRK